MRLQGKVACVTGAEQAIGRAIALQFAQEGALVLLNDTVLPGSLAHLLNEIHASGQQANTINGNVTSETEVKLMVESVLQTYQHIDIWVNAATGVLSGKAEGDNSAYTEEQYFRRLLDIDVKGTFICCNAVAPIMQSQGNGCIINMSWDAALAEGAKGTDSIMFSAAKGAVHSLSMSLAREYAPLVRVNVIAPGSMRATSLYPD
ncbi:MAG TPA: SDR family NAD(P)-dependent oxidoreductase, partial [Ktedonobacteraceae bacterium]|nr:SDR family NAD(P)-dependent oxidoreductase [Ktedonobacteraceae bacterium]